MMGILSKGVKIVGIGNIVKERRGKGDKEFKGKKMQTGIMEE